VTGGDPLMWLLEPDNPSARYLALTRLLDRPEDDLEVAAARAAIPGWGPARAMLDAQWPEGYWVGPGVGYSPKHKATVWQVIFAAALGAPCSEAIGRACTYLLDHSRLPDGLFSAYRTAGGAIACLNGNLLRAMFQLGFHDARLDASLEAMAGMVLHNGFRCRFNAHSPLPARMSDGLPCAWGAIKVLGACAQVPAERRSEAVRGAIEMGSQFLLAGDLAAGGYTTAGSPSALWQAFGFPLGYTADVLEALEVLAQAGVKGHPRQTAALELVQSKRDATGRWSLEHTPGNTWGRFGATGQPNKWVTLRALHVLKLSRG